MPFSPVYRTREVTRPTCIRGFTGRQMVKSGVFDVSTLSLTTFQNPTQYTNIYGSNLQALTGYYIPIGSILTISPNDATKVAIYSGPNAGVNDVQTVTETGAPTGGTFTLTFNGATTSAINYNSTAAQMQAILQALPTIGYGNVTCTGGALPGSGIICTFGGLLGNELLTPMTIGANNLSGGTTPAPVVTHTTPGSQGSPVVGIYDGTPWRDVFYNVVLADEAVPIFFHGASFDVSQIQNWELYGEYVEQALTTCTFF